MTYLKCRALQSVVWWLVTCGVENKARRQGVQAAPPLNHHVPRLEPAASPGPTTLESLRHYASSQTKLIESALEPPHLFKTPDNFYWMELWRATWGKDPDSFDKPEQVESGPDSTGNSLIFSGVVPSNCNVMSKPDILNNCWGPFK